MTWRSIKDDPPPKDGTSVLSYPHYRIIHWQTDYCYPEPGWAFDWDESIECWMTTKKQTHWMPLPEPPA